MINIPKKVRKVPIIQTVEDDALLRDVLRDKLRLEGFAVVESKNGQEGLALALRELPDLILLDIVMPVMDGITMMKKLRQNEWGKSVPVILLTNLSADDDRINRAIAENDPAYYLVKSNWSITDLVDKIKDRLSWRLGSS